MSAARHYEQDAHDLAEVAVAEPTSQHTGRRAPRVAENSASCGTHMFEQPGCLPPSVLPAQSLQKKHSCRCAAIFRLKPCDSAHHADQKNQFERCERCDVQQSTNRKLLSNASSRLAEATIVCRSRSTDFSRRDSDQAAVGLPVRMSPMSLGLERGGGSNPLPKLTLFAVFCVRATHGLPADRAPVYRGRPCRDPLGCPLIPRQDGIRDKAPTLRLLLC